MSEIEIPDAFKYVTYSGELPGQADSHRVDYIKQVALYQGAAHGKDNEEQDDAIEVDNEEPQYNLNQQQAEEEEE